jgi:hypothetical protein
MDNFNESRFRSNVDKALTSVKRILDNSREPRYAADVNHTYSGTVFAPPSYFWIAA